MLTLFANPIKFDGYTDTDTLFKVFGGSKHNLLSACSRLTKDHTGSDVEVVKISNRPVKYKLNAMAAVLAVPLIKGSESGRFTEHFVYMLSREFESQEWKYSRSVISSYMEELGFKHT